MQLDRRSFLVGVGASAGWLATRGFGMREPASFEETLRTLAASLTPRQRELIVLPGRPSVAADHEHDRGARAPAPRHAALARPSARSRSELYESMLSAPGREAFAARSRSRAGSTAASLAIYGEPETRARPRP